MPAVAQPKKNGQPPSEAAISAMRLRFARQELGNQKALRSMWLARLQRVLITRGAIENEVGDAKEVYSACLGLGPDDLIEVQNLHQRLAKCIADELWKHGTVDPARAAVVNTLAAMLTSTEGWKTLPWKGGAE